MGKNVDGIEEEWLAALIPNYREIKERTRGFELYRLDGQGQQRTAKNWKLMGSAGDQYI